ncbi:MAG: hypothetical protein K9M45_12985, partial [Kiritimatiellales bacterium]|nr:hypothetical protein [Kiritimatiellales bacterium]
AIIGVLASIITPAANSAVRKAKSTQCRSNLSQISKVILNYATDHQGRYPQMTNDWSAITSKYLQGSGDKVHAVFFCPAVKGESTMRNQLGDYGVNSLVLNGSRSSQIYSPSSTILMADRGANATLNLTSENDFQPVFASRRHGGKQNPEVNIVFCDGHVAGVPQDALQQALADNTIKFEKERQDSQ